MSREDEGPVHIGGDQRADNWYYDSSGLCSFSSKDINGMIRETGKRPLDKGCTGALYTLLSTYL